jgi:hypothetical protein
MFATVTLLTLVNSISGTPYISGGDSPRGTDCSGLVSFVTNAATGRPIYGDRFNTGNIEQALRARGFQYGRSPVPSTSAGTVATPRRRCPMELLSPPVKAVGCASVAVALSRSSSATTCSFRCLQTSRCHQTPLRRRWS